MLSLAGVAIGVASLSGSAGAGVGNYTGTLYISASASAIQSGSRQLTTSAPTNTSLQSQTRLTQGYLIPPMPACIDGTTCGYQAFEPGFTQTCGAATACSSPALLSSPTPNGKGWIVDGYGGVSFPPGNWTFQVRATRMANTCAVASPPCIARLAVGMWKVTAGPFATVQTLVDPTSAGENGTNFAPGPPGPLAVTQTVSVPDFSLGWNEHLYVQFWRHQITPMNGGNGNRTMTLFADDGTAAITSHPTPTGWTALSNPATGVRTNAIPQLSATFTDPVAGAAANVLLQLCSDASCGSVVQSTTATGVPSGATANWTPGGPLSDGVYYWRADTQDAATSAQSGWTATRSFTLDRNAPNVPALGAPADGLSTNSTVMSASFSDTDPTDSGSLAFRVCATSSCGSVQSSGTVTGVGNGATASWTISPSVADGLHYWQAQATDLAGNTSAWSASRSFTLDTTPPNTTLTSASPPARTNITSASFGFTATESGSTFECSLDGAAFAACTSPQSYAGPLAGGPGTDHTFQVRATDAVGNTDPTPASYAWTVDTVAPDTTIGPGKPASLSNTRAPSFDFAANETSTFECSLDGSAFASCTSPKSYSGLIDGSHTFTVRATDTAGNTDASPATYTWTIDATPPETTLGSPLPVDPTTVTNADFTFTSEAGATFSCSLDGAPYSGCASPKSYVALSDGSHTFAVKATDPAGNDDPTPASVTWRVDTLAPVTSIDAQPGKRSGENRPSFSFSASEQVTGFQCSVDGGAFSSCSSPYRTGTLADGTHSFRVRAAADLAGNAGTDVGYTWIVDTTPPSVPLPLLPADGVWTGTSPLMSATYRNPDTVDVGTVEFRVCTRAAGAGSACASRVGGGTSFITALDGHDVDWHPDVPFGEGVYYWQARAADDVGNRSDWTATRRFTLDTSPPALASSAPADGTRVRELPKFTAAFSDATPGDHGTVAFELCSDEACAGVLATGSAVLATWKGSARFGGPEPLRDGTYFWRVRAEDSVGNSSGWTRSWRIVLDTMAPEPPALAAPADGASVRDAKLSARFLDRDMDDAGSVLFRVCADPGCRIALARGSSSQVGNGATATWTPAKLRDGSYFWQAAARDAAGNTSEWSDGHAFKLDRKAPRSPRSFAGVVSHGQLLLSWRPPAGADRISAYHVLVDGVQAQELAGTTRTVTIGLFDERDDRTFTLRAVDAAGNVGPSTRVLVGVPNVVGLTTRKASSVLQSRGLGLGVVKRHTLADEGIVVAQVPTAPAVTARGSEIAVQVRVQSPARKRRR